MNKDTWDWPLTFIGTWMHKNKCKNRCDQLTYTWIYTQTQTHTHAHTYTYTQRYTHTYTCTNTHIYTYTHKHTEKNIQDISFLLIHRNTWIFKNWKSLGFPFEDNILQSLWGSHNQIFCISNSLHYDS